MMSYLSIAPRMVVSTAVAGFLILSIALPLTPALASEPPAIEVNRAEAADPEAQSSKAPKAVFSPENTGNGAQASLSPMMVEIQAAVDLGRARALELEARAAMARDEEDILAVQRKIEELAQETELAILRIQVRHARLSGKEEIAAKIEQDITDIQNPPVARTRLARPELDSQ